MIIPFIMRHTYYLTSFRPSYAVIYLSFKKYKINTPFQNSTIVVGRDGIKSKTSEISQSVYVMYHYIPDFSKGLYISRPISLVIANFNNIPFDVSISRTI